jgi:hypothetical protein
MRKRYLLLLFFTIISSGQNVYICTNSPKTIYRFNPDHTSTFICNVYNTSGVLQDIAISPDGRFFVNTSNKIYELIIETGQATLLATLPPTAYTSLVCSNDYWLYSIAEPSLDLIRYSILTGAVETVGHVGHPTSGDLTFYKGNLIFQSWTGDGDYFMMAYNLQTGVVNDIMCLPGVAMLWGLATLFIDCDIDGEILAVSGMQNMFSMAFPDSLTPFQYPTNPAYQSGMMGMASDNEHLGSLCPSVTLDYLECQNLSIPQINSGEIATYPVPSKDIVYFELDDVREVAICTLSGQLLKKINQHVNAVNVSEFETGVYILKIRTSKQSFTKKIIKL